MRLNKIEIREILNKIVEQIDSIEIQCDNVMEIIAEVNKYIAEDKEEK